jgi:hypothetical protein
MTYSTRTRCTGKNSSTRFLSTMKAHSRELTAFVDGRTKSVLRYLPLAMAALVFATVSASAAAQAPPPAPAGYDALVKLFEEWRAFEHPVIKNNLSDYSAKAMAAKAAELPKWRKRLDAIDTTGWPIAQQNDKKLVKAEMNGLDFNLRVLRPWARDPAFYVSIWPTRTDVPSREAPVSYPEIQLYDYKYPLSAAAQADLTAKIGMIPALLAEAKENLKDSNAHDLWEYGVQELRNQSHALTSLQAGNLEVRTLGGGQKADLTGASPELMAAIANAQKATDDYIAWIVQMTPTKTGPTGVGKENYTWYQQNVHMVPYTWDEEVVLLHRELERATAALRVEEHNNRNLPPLDPAPDAASFDKMAQAQLNKFIDFLVKQEMIPDKPYIREALTGELAHYTPEERQVFFSRVTARNTMPLMSHDYHWIDLGRMRDEPNPDPIRRGALLSNIWDNRAEGFATAWEEIMMRAGLYDDDPRGKELVWMMLANRAARGLASLYVQSNDFTLEQAGHFQGQWTPRGWANAKDSLTAFEQLLYARQPGYGTSYITGKLMADRLMAEYGHQQDQLGKPFVLRDFMDKFNNEGMIPASLMETEMISKDSILPPE